MPALLRLSGILNMKYLVTQRIAVKVKGAVHPEGSEIDLDLRKREEKLIADQLIECGTIQEAQDAAQNAPATEPSANDQGQPGDEISGD